MTEIIEYSCFNIKQESKNELMSLFPPKFPLLVCDHVTHTFGYVPETIPIIKTINIIGEISSEDIQVLTVEINGSHIRPDGLVYHITYSKSGIHIPDVSSLSVITELGLGIFGEFVPITDFEYDTRKYIVPCIGMR